MGWTGWHDLVKNSHILANDARAYRISRLNAKLADANPPRFVCLLLALPKLTVQKPHSSSKNMDTDVHVLRDAFDGGLKALLRTKTESPRPNVANVEAHSHQKYGW